MKESFKSFLLVALTGLLVVLVGILWFEPSKADSAAKDQKIVSPISDVSYLIDVESVNIVTDNDQIKTFFYDVGNLFKSLKPRLASSLLNIEDSTPISRADYYAARGRNSVEFCLPAQLPTQALLSIINNSDILFKPRVDFINTLLVSGDGAIFFSGDGAYYALNNPPIADIDGYLPYLDLSDEVVYSTIDQQLNLAPNGVAQTLLPTAIATDFKPLQVAPETTAADESAVLLLADKVFGSRLNFVRRFFDVNNSVVMLYGYGEQALKISKDGVLTVSQKINPQIADEANLLKDFKLAVDSINNYNQIGDNLFLKSVTVLERDGLAGYQFSFGYKVNGYQVVEVNQPAAVQIDIVAGQMQLYRRHCKRYGAVVDSEAPAQTLPILAIVNQQSNYDLIVANYVKKHGEIWRDQAKFMQILAQLTNFSMRYVDRGSRLEPAYCFDIAEHRYYFSAEDFSLIEEVQKQ